MTYRGPQTNYCKDLSTISRTSQPNVEPDDEDDELTGRNWEARTKFIARLSGLLHEFDHDRAVALSDEIHKAEAEGYKVGTYEDRLWANLTDRIKHM